MQIKHKFNLHVDVARAIQVGRNLVRLATEESTKETELGLQRQQ
jgi:hypothetical protein